MVYTAIYNDADSHADHSTIYTSLDAFARHGPPDMTLSLKDGPDLLVHSLVIRSLSNVLRQVPTTAVATEAGIACEVIPLDGDEALSWGQTLTAMYLSMDGACLEDTLTALLVSPWEVCWDRAQAVKARLPFH